MWVITEDLIVSKFIWVLTIVSWTSLLLMIYSVGGKKKSWLMFLLQELK